jgi:hypothetical protein
MGTRPVFQPHSLLKEVGERAFGYGSLPGAERRFYAQLWKALPCGTADLDISALLFGGIVNGRYLPTTGEAFLTSSLLGAPRCPIETDFYVARPVPWAVERLAVFGLEASSWHLFFDLCKHVPIWWGFGHHSGNFARDHTGPGSPPWSW